MSLPFQHSAADVVRWLLVQMGLGSDPTPWLTGPDGNAWPVFVGSEPSIPDQVLTVYNTTPQNDGRSMPDGAALKHWGIQIRVRAQDNPTGTQKVHAIHQALNEQVQGDVLTLASPTAVYVVYAVSKTTLMDLGKDTPSTKRSLFTLNAVVAIDRLS